MTEPYQDVRDANYFRKVIHSMVHVDRGARTNPTTTVRFGKEGHGIHPNYLVVTVTGSHSFLGSNHKLDARTAGKQYVDAHLSNQSFTLQGVQQLLRDCIARSEK